MKCEILKEDDNQIHLKADCYQNKHLKISGINFILMELLSIQKIVILLLSTIGIMQNEYQQEKK